MKIEVTNIEHGEEEEKPLEGGAAEQQDQENEPIQEKPEEEGRESSEAEKEGELKRETALLWEKRNSLKRAKEIGEKEGFDTSDTVKTIEAEIADIKKWISEFSANNEKAANLFILDSMELSGMNKNFKGLQKDLRAESGEEGSDDPILRVQEIRKTISSIGDDPSVSLEDLSEVPYSLGNISAAAKEIAEQLRSIEEDTLNNDIFDDTASWLMSVAELADEKKAAVEEKIRASKEKE
ncbi:MAG: hypothetical protein WC926_01675 [Candidatus Paceibacterota bacterium]|jgi:hypothetical protein